MRKVGGNSGGVHNIVKRKLVNEGGELQKKGQGLERTNGNRLAAKTIHGGRVVSVRCPRLWELPHLSDTASGSSNNCPRTDSVRITNQEPAPGMKLNQMSYFI